MKQNSYNNTNQPTYTLKLKGIVTIEVNEFNTNIIKKIVPATAPIKKDTNAITSIRKSKINK